MSFEDAPGGDDNSLELFDTLAHSDEPYSGEVRLPITMLDAMALDTITKFGNDNLPPPPDPYQRGPVHRRLDPAVRTTGRNGGRLGFGEDYMTHHFDLPNQRMICVYNKKHARAEVVVDGFRPGEGLVFRTTFRGSEKEPDAIWKSHQTDFSTGDLAIFGFIDFSRKLKNKEQDLLREILISPEHHTNEANELVRVNRKEAKITLNNRRKHDELLEKHQEALDSIVKARRIAEQRARDIWIS